MSDSNLNDASFTPEINDSEESTNKQTYSATGSFRFWCQKVLPLVYDDSLSYYELLCKVVNYLNNVIQNVDNLNTSVDNTNTAFDNLQNYVNTTKDTLVKVYGELEQYVNDYFNNLDVQDEINSKLDSMAEDGSLSTIISPFIPTAVSEWLSHNITPTTPAIDASLSISGAGADAKVTGDSIKNVEKGNTVDFVNNINYLYGTPINGYYNPYNGSGVGPNADWSYYPKFKIEGGFYYCASYNGAHVAFYDENNEYISGVLVNNTITNFDFLAPVNAKYATYSYLTASGNQYFMRSTKQKIEYNEPKHKTLNYDVSIDPFSYINLLNFGKNLFNKYNLIEGYCLDYGNGARIWRNSSYCFCPDYIPADELTDYYRNRPCIIVEYDEDLNVLATHNFTATYNGTFTTESGTKFLRIGTLLTHTGGLQVERGTTGTDYQSFGYSLKYEIDKLPIHTVKQDGTGDYETISDAVTYSSDDDIIIVYPGEYEESVHAYSKRVHIIGVNRKTCILKYSGLDYSNPPLEMAKGSVRNLTILATNSGTQGDRPAYCVHIDNDNEAGEALSFFNVDFINEVHQAVGVGLRADFTLTFDTCRFKAENQAALYCHDWETSDTAADKTGQRLIVRNCSIVNNSASKATIMLQSQELIDKGAEAVFIGNSVVNASGALISMTLWSGRTLTNINFMGSSDWVLSSDSALNSTDMINASALNISYTTPTALLNRVTDVVGGYCKIGKIVYVNLSFKASANHSGTPSVLGGLPKPLNSNAVLSAVKATSGIGSSMEENALCGVNNTSLYMNAIVTDAVYYVTGSYIAES